MKKREAFTLIELIAVLVILAILALIVTPLVMNIIRKARVSADKRSIDAYGRSIELAIADYLLEKGEIPTSIDQLTIEYSGDKVECNTTTLNEDGGVYLAECTVAGRNVSGYTYGKKELATYLAYEIGQIIEYKGINFYVIKNSSANEDTITLLKTEPLTYEDIQTYSTGTGAETYDNNGIGGMQYSSNSSNYETSYVKKTIDSWAQESIGINEYNEVRLITLEELKNNLGYILINNGSLEPFWQQSADTPTWVYDIDYWTMSQYNDSEFEVYTVGRECVSNSSGVYGNRWSAVRPVIVISKSALN